MAMHQINPTQSLPTKRSAGLSRGFTPAGSKAIQAEFKQEYGWLKMCKELLARGIRVGKPPGGGLEHEAAYANQRCDGCFAHGVVSPPTGAGFDLSLGSWQSILQP